MMTTLQIVLALVGVALIGAIVLYNIVQERRFRKEADRMFSHRREDIMLGESVGSGGSEDTFSSRISLSNDEPASREVVHAVDEAEASVPEMPANALRRDVNEADFDLPSIADHRPVDFTFAGHTERDTEAVEPDTTVQPVLSRAPDVVPSSEAKVFEGASVAPALTPASPPPSYKSFQPAVAPTTSDVESIDDEDGDQPQRSSGLDSETEFIARIRFASPTAANFGPLLTTLRRVGKPIRAYSQRLDGHWEPLTSNPRSRYAQVEIGLQLADRGGAVTHDQLDAFCRALYGFAAEGGGAVTCPDKQDALQAAKALDLLCMEVDVLIGLNVISSESRPFTSEVIHKQAEEARLVLEADGVYHARDDFGQTLFTLANQDEHPFPADGRGLTVRGLTLLFDVPRVAEGLAVFDRMTRLGFDLAWRLEGRLVDDNSRAVTEENLNRDRKRLAGFYSRMDSRGIPAGGERALRLFV